MTQDLWLAVLFFYSVVGYLVKARRAEGVKLMLRVEKESLEGGEVSKTTSTTFLSKTILIRVEISLPFNPQQLSPHTQKTVSAKQIQVVRACNSNYSQSDERSTKAI